MKHAHGTVMPELGVPGGDHCWPPKFLADQSTLFQPGRADYPHLLLLAHPMFITFWHHWVDKIFELIYAGINVTFTTESHSTYSYEM